MSVVLYPFKSNFIGEEEVTVWAVNCDNPENTGGMMTMEKCPHCNETNIYKFTEEPFEFFDDEENQETEESYHCECASCREYFVAQIGLCY